MVADPAPRRRSDEWFRGDGYDAVAVRSTFRRGVPDGVLGERPVVGICNTGSDLVPCNSHLPRLAEDVAHGVWEAGGYPLTFHTMPVGELPTRPTSMYLRNLLALEVEEVLRANPLDVVVLLGGCDKTTPALLMGAVSARVPAIAFSAGPMSVGTFCGERLGSGTSLYAFTDRLRTGAMSRDEYGSLEAALTPTVGTCNTMGTASTMAAILEAMGLALPRTADVPAVSSARAALAHETGRASVRVAASGRALADLLTPAHLRNALRTLCALGGSPNCLIHLTAIARRAGLALELDTLDEIARTTPVVADVRPAGRLLMDDFSAAGGVPAVLHQIRDDLELGAATVWGSTLGEVVDRAVPSTGAAIAVGRPAGPKPAFRIVRGNLCPRGAVLKTSTASAELLQHRGPAVVFDGEDDLRRRIDDPDLDVTPSSVLVLRGCGPRGYPGMPELGAIPIPTKLLAAGVRDVLRISDARMSGTAGGTVVLHVTPEAAADGPIGRLRDGDVVVLDAAQGRLDVELTAEELAARAPLAVAADDDLRGWAYIHHHHVGQADQGCDLEFPAPR